jgi:hypothetical protein
MLYCLNKIHYQFPMLQTFKGVSPAGSPEREARLFSDKRERRSDQPASAIVQEQNPLQNLMLSGVMNEQGQIDSLKLETIVLKALKSDKADWANVVEDFVPHIEKILEDLKNDSEFSSLNDNIETALGSIRQSEMLKVQHEEEISQKSQRVQEIAGAGEKDEEELHGLFKQFKQLSDTLDNRKLELDSLLKTKGFFARIFSPSVRSLKLEIQNLESQTDRLSQTIDERKTSTAQSKVSTRKRFDDRHEEANQRAYKSVKL